MLKILRTEGLNVPYDLRTLLQTPKTHSILNLSNGSYIHLGLDQMLTPILNKYNAKDNLPNLTLKIDGLPISRSSINHLWSTLISILNFKEVPNNVLPIDIFHGTNKPKCINEFIDPFSNDILNVLSKGLNVNNILFKLEISNIVCDAPAKTFF